MMRTMLKCKIHRATVTEAVLHYEGSITIDQTLMEAAGLVEYEQERRRGLEGEQGGPPDHRQLCNV
jgi:hypothetical protein